MADVKFMDLSENDNPATTDSILIGNSTDGLKRTSVGTLGNLFSVKGLFHTELVTGKKDPKDGAATITAPTVPGYTFAFWLAPSLVASSMYSHVDNPASPNANLWIPNSPGWETTPTEFSISAVYVNSKVA